MEDFLVPPMTCPGCGVAFDGALNTDGARRPEPGDPTICVHCRALLVFGVGELRHPSPEEEQEFLADVRIQAAIRAVDEMHRLYGPPR